MLNFELKDGERFVGSTLSNDDADRADFANLVERYMGREAVDVFNDCIIANEGRVESIVEEAVCEAEEPFVLLLNDVTNELEAIINGLDNERLNKAKLRKELMALKTHITGSGLY